MYSQHSEWEYQTCDDVDLSLHENDPVDWHSFRDVVPIYAAASPDEDHDTHDESENGDYSTAGCQAAGSATASRKSADHIALPPFQANMEKYWQLDVFP